MIKFHANRVLLLIGTLFICSCARTATLPKNASAEAIFEAATTDMNRRLYPEAIKGFEQVRIKYPYSKLAPTATLRSGDCHLKAGQPMEAIESYRLFLQLFPRHNEVPYATYRIGEAHLARAPQDYWFNPPIYEKDLGPVKQSVDILQDFLRKYNLSTYAEDARAVLEKAQGRLISHELYVAKFNYKRKQYSATVGRAMGLIEKYPQHPLNAPAYLLAAQSSARQGLIEDGTALGQHVIDQYPNTKEAKKAAKLLKNMDKIQKKYNKEQKIKAAKKAKIKKQEERKAAKAAKKEQKKAAKQVKSQEAD